MKHEKKVSEDRTKFMGIHLRKGLMDELEAWIAKQSIPVTKNAVIRKALQEFLQKG